MTGRISGRIAGLAATLIAAFGPVAGAQSAVHAAARGTSGHHAASTADRPTRYVVAPTGNEARYRVREQLVGVELPNDAVGTVHEISGTLLVDPNGAVVRDSSRIVVRMKKLTSDKTRRDGYVQRRTLETSKFPTVELVPTALNGLTPASLTSTPTPFVLAGDLTVHGVTRPTTWKATAHTDGADIVGTASTWFTFKDFSLNQPSVPVVLSVNDTITLEYDFRFSPAGKTP
jgi:YceI-like domain.